VSGWTSYTDKPHRSAAQTAAEALAAAPGLLTAEYVERCSVHSASAIKAALHKLKVMGYATSRRVTSPAGRGNGHVVTWQPTQRLIRQIAAGEPIKVHRDARVALLEELEDDGWTPQPYVNPIRARIHGVPSRRAA
jgi:hypothetical protein